jgi:hypothetical protein
VLTRNLHPHGRAVGIPFLLLGVTLAVAGVGWFKLCPWGWRLAVGIIGVQVLREMVNALMGGLVRGGVGFIIAGALLNYLLRPEVRAALQAPVRQALFNEFEQLETGAFLR